MTKAQDEVRKFQLRIPTELSDRMRLHSIVWDEPMHSIVLAAIEADLDRRERNANFGPRREEALAKVKAEHAETLRYMKAAK